MKEISIWIGNGKLSQKAINYFGEQHNLHSWYLQEHGIFTDLTIYSELKEGYPDYVAIMKDDANLEKVGYFFHDSKWTEIDFHNAILCLAGNESKCPKGIEQTKIITNPNNGNGLGLFDFDLCRYLMPKSLEFFINKKIA